MSYSKIDAQPLVSVEYFPPRGLSAERALMTGAHALRRFQPAYQTITFGTGDCALENSLDWALNLQGLTEIDTACHIALNHFNASSLAEFAEQLWHNGIKKLVVLRGDAISASGAECAGFPSVADAISALKALYPFDVSVAAYPQIHPKAASLREDLQILLDKQKAGANRAITQYFFNNDDFYKFRTLARKEGVYIPLVPGIMPISNFAKIKEFSKKCGISVPSHFEAKFIAAGEDKAKQTAVARRLVEAQVRDLAQNGVEALHIYSLNRVDLTADAIRAFEAEFNGNEGRSRIALAS